jgi:CheY-like chemotaxis protein
LAEDNPINVRVAVGLLEKRGYKVTVAGNGREAIQALDRDIFDVVLMDMHMPELDGLEATRAIRQKEKTTGLHVPIIALTAAAMKSDEEECLAAGMDAYIAKPFQASVLFNTLEATMKRFANTGGRSSASTPLSSASARHQSRPYPVESKLVSGL